MSPTVFRKSGFAFMMYFPPMEHPPAHVHVRKGGVTATFWLADGSVRSAGRMRSVDVARAQRIVASRLPQLMQSWRAYHEKDENK